MCIPFWIFLLFNAICIGKCNSSFDLIFKRSYLAFECSDVDGVFSFAFAFMWTTISDKNQNFENFGRKHVFMQASKISGIPSLHHSILSVVIIIEK